MPSRRTSIALTEEEAEKFLDDGWTLQVASVGPGGYPHLVAMWYVMIDGLIHFTTFTKSQKILNLKRDAKITCMLEDGRAYAELRGLVIEGEAEVIDDDVELSMRVIGLTGAKYSGTPLDAGPDEQRRKAASKRATVRIRPRRVYSWDHHKLGGRY